MHFDTRVNFFSQASVFFELRLLAVSVRSNSPVTVISQAP